MKMENNRDCKIIQDLLPSYIDKLTNEETNHFIEDHMAVCEECKQTLENMQKELTNHTNKRDNREVKYIKKYSHKMKMLKCILLIIILGYALLVGRRTFIMLSLSQKAKENRLNDNYYAKLYSYQGTSLTITESYHKGEDYLTTMTRFDQDKQINQITFYKKGPEEICFTQWNGQKYLQDMGTMVGGQVLPVTYVSDGFFANLQYAFLVGIDSTYCNGRACYVIKGNSYERYIDKETGVAVRDIEKSSKSIERQTDMVVDYEYQYNVVKEEDIVKPDITDAIVHE